MSNVQYDVPNSNGVLVHCPNLDCNYTWRYAGRFILYNTYFKDKDVTVVHKIQPRLKKAHRISNKTLVVIDEVLVEQLSIDDEIPGLNRFRPMMESC